MGLVKIDKMITINKVVTKNFVEDFIAKIQNIAGVNLTSYEKMVKKGIAQIKEELEKDAIELDWFRYETTQLTNGALSILLYGERK